MASTDGPLLLSPQVSETEADDVARGCWHKSSTGEEAIEKAYQVVWQSLYGLSSEESYPTFDLQGQDAYERLHKKLDSHPELPVYFDDEDVQKDCDASTVAHNLSFIFGS